MPLCLWDLHHLLAPVLNRVADNSSDAQLVGPDHGIFDLVCYQ